MQTEIDRTRNAADAPGRSAATVTSSNEFIDHGVASQAWRVDFARIYAARESCTLDQAGRAASILCESLCLLPPLVAAGIVLAHGDLLAALRIATREAREDLRSADLTATDFSWMAVRA